MQENAVLVEMSQLELSYPVQYFRTQTVRDLFIGLIKSPFQYLIESKKTTQILKGISFSIKQGEKVALIGINGSGKTSLCRCISGVLRPSAGRITKNCQVRAIIQTEAGFFPELTGRENAWLMSEFLYADLSPQERSILIDEVLEFSELGSYSDVPIESYSLGMKSRLSLSLITARPAQLLILDEVGNHADEFFRKKIELRIKRNIDQAQAVLIVSHYGSDLIENCKRGILLDKGKIAFDGPVEKALSIYRILYGDKSV